MVGPDLDHLMTLVLIFMGSRKRVMNPHLRAHLAEMLECLLPATEDEPNTLISRYVILFCLYIFTVL